MPEKANQLHRSIDSRVSDARPYLQLRNRIARRGVNDHKINICAGCDNNHRRQSTLPAAEHDGATGSLIREYIWLDDVPLALVAGSVSSPSYYYVHTGQIGEPLIVTDASKAKVWDAAVDPWGKPSMLATPTQTINLRLPGQWYASEGALHQNWMRDYDPNTGRYIEADPLGIDAGANLYPYVDSNPLNLTDLSGLSPLIAACPLAGPDAPACAGADLVGSAITALVGIYLLSHPIDQAKAPPIVANTDQPCDQQDDKCQKAKADAARAYRNLTIKRIPDYLSGGSRGSDLPHYNSVLQRQRNLKDAIRRVRLYCRPLPPELPEWERVANLQIPPQH